MIDQSLTNTVIGVVQSLFIIPFIPTFWSILLLLVFVLMLLFGYYLIANQIKLVKKELWNWADRIKSGFYAIFFACGVEIVVAMMIIFTIGQIEPSTTINTYIIGGIKVYETEGAHDVSSCGIFILIPLAFSMVYMLIYPVFELANMAMSEKKIDPATHKEVFIAQTPYQKVFEVILIKGKGIISLIWAIILYIIFFLLPPYLLIVYGHIDFIFAVVSWELIFPLSILCYYGVKGYIASVSTFYNKIPRLGRSIFLSFEEPTRGTAEFLRDPISRVFAGLLLFAYVWAGYNFTITIVALNPYYAVKSTLSYAFTVYIVLFFGIYGYFSKFWGRKIKFRTNDLLFSAYLIGAVGVGVLVNFLVFNSIILRPVFSQWILTQPINAAWVPYTLPANAELPGAVLQARWFAPAADIQAANLIVWISYYFFERKHAFMNDAIYSTLTKSGEIFEAYTPFNLAKSPDKRFREHAYDMLKTMYDRIPLKAGLDLLDPLYKDPLFDALCDPNPYSRNIGMEILRSLILNHAKKILPAVEDALKSPNYDKAITVGNVVLQYGDKFIPLLSSATLFHMFQQNEYHLRRLAIQMMFKYYTKNKCPAADDSKLLVNALKDPDYEVQAKILEFSTVCSIQMPPDMIIEKLHNPSPLVQSAAAVAASKIKFEDMASQALPALLKMLDSSNPEIRASVMEALSRVGQFDQRKIPIKPFVDSLFNVNEKIRSAAVKGVIRYLKDNPNGVDLKPFLNQIKNKDIGIQKSLLQVLGAGWKQMPDKIIPFIIKNLKGTDAELKESAIKILADMAVDNPLAIAEKLIVEKETESYIRKGMIASTLIQICNKNPQKVIPFILNSLNDTKPNVQENAISVLSEISEKNPGDINIKQLITLWMTKLPTKTKKDIAKTVVNVVLAEPEKIKPFVGDLTKGLSEPDKTLRKTIAKLFVDLGEKIPSLIPLNAIKIMVADTDPNIRELGMNLIKAVGDQYPKESLQYLSAALKDKEWNVKNAAATAFGELGSKFNSPEIFSQIKAMLKDPEKWTRMKALESIQKIVERKVKIMTIDEAYQLLGRKNEEELFLVAAAKILASVAADDFKKAFPLLIKTLSYPNPKVREALIGGMVKLLATQNQKKIIPDLLKYLSDETEMTLQQSIALLLKRVVKYESVELKNRLLSLLRIRCQMSQDPIICEVMTEIEKEVK